MMINTIINGAHGKMGKEAVKAVESDAQCQLVGAATRQDNLGHMIDNTKAHVVVDLTHPSAVFENVQTILNHHAHAVVGTTGLTDMQLEQLNQLAIEQRKCVFVCPNFAIGAVLMMKFAAEAATHLESVEIIELHHNKKADAPSGTALKTAELIYAENPHVNPVSIDETETVQGARGGNAHNIPIHSVRLPGLVANQAVILGGLGETLTIKHETISRESFMPGILHCIKQTQTHSAGLVYGLEKLL